ncbi:MAG: hypothetical protein D3915_05940 [Candidatus Electrothrix sp. AU1_5]|nr:hypothetical protein [Candidatus Electrothrix gigas]
MISEKKNKHSFASFFICSARSLLRAALLLLLCSNPLAAQNAPETVNIKLPYNGPEMRFKAVYLGIKDKPFPRHFASREFQLGSRDPSKQTYKQQRVSLDLAGSFIGSRNGNEQQQDWLYYLGETEVSRGQWNSIMRWMDEQEGKNSAAKELDDSQAQLPKNKITVAQVYRFIEALNTWMLQQQKDKLPRIGQSYAFARLPTEAEWAFAARGGIKVLENDPDRFNRSHPYTEELGNYEWYSTNSGSRPRKCGSNKLANPIGLRDMLGNVEELTLSLFGPQYVHGRLGQFVIRGNSFRDSSKYVDVSCRTEFASHSSEGKLILSDRVGFRLALSSAISASGRSDVLNSECKLYVDSLESKEPSLVNETPATKAEKNSRKYSESETNRFKADIKKKNSEISRLQRLRNKDQVALEEMQQESITYRYRKEQLEATVHDLEKKLSARPESDTVDALQRKLRQAKREIQHLKEESQKLAAMLQKANASNVPSLTKLTFQDLYEQSQTEVKDLRQQIAAMPPRKEWEKDKQQLAHLQKKLKERAFEGSSSQLKQQQRIEDLERNLDQKQQRVAEFKRNLEKKQQRIEDLERRQFGCENTIAENAKLAKIAEKRYLEALMRQASANAYIGFRLLKKRKAYLTLPQATPKRAEAMHSEASQMIHDYWHLVVQMAEETQARLFPEVKQEVATWLKDREDTGGAVEQRKALHLIERHLQTVRSGRSLPPNDLVESFLDQQEFYR